MKRGSNAVLNLVKASNELTRNHFTERFDSIKSMIATLREQLLRNVEAALADLTRKVEERLARVKDGKDGKTPTKEQLTALIKPLIPPPIKGDKGDPGTTTTYTLFGKSQPGKDGSPDTGEQIVDKINALPTDNDDDKIDAKHIKNLPESKTIIETGGGGSSTISGLMDVYMHGITSGQVLRWNGTRFVPYTPSVSGLSIIAMTGTVNDSNVNFTAASEPIIVVVNGTSYRHGKGVTISGTTITLDNPVGTGGDIYGL